MHSLMMTESLSITSIINHAEKNYSEQQIVSLTSSGVTHRFTYKEIFKRTRQLANALVSMGVKPGDRVATMAWNDHRHLELYYAISCIGAVCHTINPRLFKEQISYIANHAEDICLFLDSDFTALIEGVEPELTHIDNYVVLCDEADMPETSLPNVSCYETMLSEQDSEFDWPEIEENQASSLCYTSGTTGNPKGVLYSHRSNILHSYASALPDAMNLSALDSVLPVVPMFHANAWGLNYSVLMVGAKFVLPGNKAGDPEILTKLMNEESVTLSAGVPTVWLALLNYLSDNKQTLASLNRTVVGGAACPPSIIEEFKTKHDVNTVHAWGMTELSPLGTLFSPMPGFEQLSENQQNILKAKQGRAPFGVQLKIVDDNDVELPWDGTSFGALKAKGNWVSDRYYKSEEKTSSDAQGWFETGDVATIDEYGFMNIVDRTKDVIKSGGEWISSVELEGIAQGHPAVKEVAVIGVPDPQWTERPVFIVALNDSADEDDDMAQSILEFMVNKVAKWWIPEKVFFVDELPHTATGKVSKLQLRKEFS